MNSVILYMPPLERLVTTYGVTSKVSKQLILTNNLDKVFNGYSRDLYKFECDIETSSNIDYDSFLLRHIYFKDRPNVKAVCSNLNKARYKRSSRLETYIEMMLELGACYFLTLTFNDNVLQKTTEQTRRKYVSRVCSVWSPYYIANIDYGSKNGREHYHCVICAPKGINDALWTKYGFIDVKPVKEPNCECLAKYVTKLTNHALKDTGQSKRVVYSNDLKNIRIQKYYRTQIEKLKNEIDKLQQMR